MNCPHCGKEIVPQDKSITSPLNALMGRKRHVDKVRHFLDLRIFDELKCNEYLVKIPLRKGTYNPDYYHQASETFIEIATSLPNISEQRHKWQEAMKSTKLRVFWWEGLEITDEIRKGSRIERVQHHTITYEHQV